MKKYFSVSMSTISLLLPLLAVSAELVPESGLRAENNGQWKEAVKAYQQELGNHPAQPHLWVRVSDIQVRLGDLHAAAAALNEAIRYVPGDPVLYVKLSEVHAVANEPKPALAAINRAVKIEPDNIKYLRARGELAIWNEDFAVAGDSYTRILVLAPNDGEAKLGLARTDTHMGKKDKAAEIYRAYLAKHPKNKEVMLEYIGFEAECGNIPALKEYSTIYRERFGEDMAYWLRMADNYALAGDDNASAEAVQQATRFAPNDPALFFRLSQAYPSVKDVKRASAAIERAVQLEPNNLEYLRTRADLAASGADYTTALDSYVRILRIAPDDAGAMLGIARVLAWKGDSDEASKRYKTYLDKFPQVQVAWMEYISVETERGDYALAMELLERYRERFGENAAYLKQKARVLASADRPSSSLSIVSDIRPSMPNDYELGYTRTLALAAAHRPSDALTSLEDLVKLDPANKETVDIQRTIKTPLRSNINLASGYEVSSDNITIRHVGVDGEYVVTPETRIFGGVDKQWLYASAGSGFVKLDGSQNLGYQRDWVGVRSRTSPKVSLDAQVGVGDADGKGNFIYEIGADLQPKDELNMRVNSRQDLYAVSPRAADLGIQRRANMLTMSWMPNLSYTVDSQLSYDTFSDGNRHWELDLAPRRAFVRSQRLNLDLGIGARWFGFQKDPNNGYYAPNTYDRYSLNAYSYWKISDDDGVGVSASIGPWKDNTMNGYRTGDDLGVEGIFGLYLDWELNARASLSNYGGEGAGGYRSKIFNLNLTKRF